jgi:peptide/nickel transport system substrate-binding protein
MHTKHRVDQLRSQRSELENHYIDELLAGRLDRRQFLRRGAQIGMSSALIAAVLDACGGSSKSTSRTAAGTPRRGGTLRVALLAPGSAINPLTTDDTGNNMLAQVGEYLVFDDNLKHRLVPMLATSWRPNSDGTVWTFTLRKGVKFHSGQPMTADDVVWTFQQLSDPKLPSNALSTFQNILSPAGVAKVDDHTVAFHLDSANGNFPYLVSGDNYNSIIVPKGTDFAKWQRTFIGTGAFKLQQYSQNVGASFVRNPAWWGGRTHLDGTKWSFYSSVTPQDLALQGGDVDVIAQFSAQGGQALLHNPAYKVVSFSTSEHRELSLRNDRPPFNDARVRRAVALTLDRPAMVKALVSGYGQVGNDNPFAPQFPSRNPNVPQRTQNVAEAKQLLAAAGQGSGVKAHLYTESYQEVPALAQAIKSYAAAAGITFDLTVESQDQYYGKSTFGQSDWLDGEASLVDYGPRGVPNVFLESPLTSHGPWNAARFKNATYDRLVKQYVAALDLASQRRIAGQIEKLLLNETPIVIPYWLDGLIATTSKVHGITSTHNMVYLARAYID